MIVKFEVGAQAPAPFWPSRTVDGAVLHQDAEGGVIVAIYINRPTKDEMAKLSSRIEARGTVEPNGCGLWFAGFGGNFYFELTQNPALYPPAELEQRLMWWGNANLWHFIVIDCATGILLKNRVTNAPKRLMESIQMAMTIAATEKNFNAIYDAYLKRCMARTTEQLWESAVYLGKFGDDVER